MDLWDEMTDLPTIEFIDGIATAQRSSSEMLRELLGVLDHELERRGLPVKSSMRDGLAPSAVEDAFNVAGLSAPEEVIIWFGWHNGSRIKGQPLPNLYPVSLEEAMKIHALMQQVPEAEDPNEWSAFAGHGWLRLGSETLDVAIDCRTPAELPLLRQPSFDFDEQTGQRQARSLCTWVTWRIQGLRNGAYGQFSPEQGSWAFDPGLVDRTQLQADFR